MVFFAWLLLIIAFFTLPVLISIVLETMRRSPQTPESLYWNSDIPVRYLTIDNTRIRYIMTGTGPALVLLHTLRTQLDIFQKIIPDLAGDFTVYALDYPGHGFSDIPKTDYTPELFVDTVEKFLDAVNIRNATLAGVSIGGSIPLLIAAKKNSRVRNIIAINPYDYGKGRGVERGNFVAWLIFTLARIPVLGETVMRFRNRVVEKIIMQGGVATPDALPQEFLEQIWKSGTRNNHYRGFINLIRNAEKWETARQEYKHINIPVHLVYGDHDWSNETERKRNRNEIPGATFDLVSNGGHFLPLDQPHDVIRLIRQYALSQ